MNFDIPSPDQQINFAVQLSRLRSLFLQEALFDTVKQLEVSTLDEELKVLVPSGALNQLAAKGLRGELVFPVPSLLRANPRLLGYYRLLLGFSQKAFYTRAFGTTSFKSMETDGRIGASCVDHISDLCAALIESSLALLSGLSKEVLTQDLLDDITIMTLGPQLRGGANVKVGSDAISDVFNVIHEIVKHVSEPTQRKNCIQIKNAADRVVYIEFAADPDIIIREELSPENYRNTVAIEVKGGKDFSNIHNRIGEAEKSHQKARKSGYTECWTIVNVDRFDREAASISSPSTDRFYRISDLVGRSGGEFQDFKGRILSLAGIREAE